jgi:hypothetical protein
MMSFSGRLLSEKLDVLRLAFYTAPVSLGVLLPLFYLSEVRTLSLLQHDQDMIKAMLFLYRFPRICSAALHVHGPIKSR